MAVSVDNSSLSTENADEGRNSTGHVADVASSHHQGSLLESEGTTGSLRSSIQWSLIGNVFYAACQWAVLILIAKLSNPESVGQFTLGLAITAPIILFANLNLSAILATDAKRDYSFGHYLAIRLATTLLSILAIAAVLVGGNYDSKTVFVIIAVTVAKAFEAVSDIYLGVLQQHHRFERVAWSLMIKGGVSILAVTIGFLLTGSIIGAVVGLAATNVILMFAYDLHSIEWLHRADVKIKAISGDPNWDWKALSRLIWIAFPVGLRVMLLALCANIPRYFIEMNDDMEALGIFAALAYVSVVVQVISNAISQAASPRLASFYAAGDIAGFRMLVYKLSALLAVLGGAGVGAAMLLGQFALTLLYSKDYAVHSTIFTWIMVSAGLWCVSTVFAVAANAGRQQGSQVIAGIVITIATLIASAILIPRDSLHGAAITSVISAAVGLIAFGVLFLLVGNETSTNRLKWQRATRKV